MSYVPSLSRPRTANPTVVPRYTYFVTTAPDPGALPRILEMFALRDIIPDHVHCRVTDDGLSVEISARGLSRQMAEHLETRIATFPVVASARLTVEDYCEAVA